MIRIEANGEVLKVWINRPEKRNAISSRVMEDLETVCEKIEKERKFKALILTGEGKVFSAGADLKEIATLFGKAKHEFTQRAQLLLQRIEQLPLLTLAAINGHAFGGGLELALACDLRFIVPGAKIGLTEVRLGLIPAWGGTQRLPKLIKLGKAKQMILLGEPIDATQALELGLVSRICSPERLMQEAEELARSLPSDVGSRKESFLVALGNSS